MDGVKKGLPPVPQIEAYIRRLYGGSMSERTTDKRRPGAIGRAAN